MSDLLDLPPGVHDDIPEQDYHADRICPAPSASCSILQTILSHSPAHAKVKHPRLNPAWKEEHADKFVRGQAVHAMLFGGHRRFVVVDEADWKKKDAQATKKQAYADGNIPMLGHQWEQVSEIAKRIRGQLDGHPELGGLLETARHMEATVVWREGRDGFWCRMRTDLVAHDAIYDLKLTGDAATPESWAYRTAHNMGYPFRAVFYERGWRAATGEDLPYRFIVVEDEEPHALAWFALAPEIAEPTAKDVDLALRIWGECMSTGRWPGYSTELQWIQAPSWAVFRNEERSARAEMDTLRMARRAVEKPTPALPHINHPNLHRFEV